MKKSFSALILVIFLNLFFFVSATWSESAQKSKDVTCLPIDLCGKWVGCAKVNLSRKMILGTDYSAACRKRSSFGVTRDEKNKLTYLSQTACFRIQPIKFPPPEKICPESCISVSDCPSGPVQLTD